MVNKYIFPNNHYSLVTSKFSTIKKTLKQFYLINQLLLLMCLLNVNITHITASIDFEIIPHWFFGGITPNFSIVYHNKIKVIYDCKFFLDSNIFTDCEFSSDMYSLIPKTELPYDGKIHIGLSWELLNRERKRIRINLSRALRPNFTSINFPPIYCCIKGTNLTFTGSNFYSLFKPKIFVNKEFTNPLFCHPLNDLKLTCNRPLFRNNTEQKLDYEIASHGASVFFESLYIKPLPHFIWAISKPQLSVIIEPKWVEFVDPVIIKVYRSSGDLLVECTVQVDLQSDLLTCDQSTPKEEPSTLSCVVTFETETIPATTKTTVTSHITIPTITEVTTVTTQSDAADSNVYPSATIIIILVVLIFNFLAWTVYLFYVNRLLARKLSLASLSTLSSISRIPYITVTSKDTHELTKFTLSTLSSEQVSSRSGKSLKKKGGPPTK